MRIPLLKSMKYVTFSSVTNLQSILISSILKLGMKILYTILHWLCINKVESKKILHFLLLILFSHFYLQRLKYSWVSVALYVEEEWEHIVTFGTYVFENLIFLTVCLTAQRICRNFHSEWGSYALLLLFILVLQALISRIKQKNKILYRHYVHLKDFANVRDLRFQLFKRIYP